MEAHNETKTEVDLRFKRIADWLGRVEGEMTAPPENGHLPKNIWCKLKTKKDKTSHLLTHDSDNSSTSEGYSDWFETEQKSES